MGKDNTVLTHNFLLAATPGRERPCSPARKRDKKRERKPIGFPPHLQKKITLYTTDGGEETFPFCRISVISLKLLMFGPISKGKREKKRVFSLFLFLLI